MQTWTRRKGLFTFYDYFQNQGLFICHVCFVGCYMIFLELEFIRIFWISLLWALLKTEIHWIMSSLLKWLLGTIVLSDLGPQESNRWWLQALWQWHQLGLYRSLRLIFLTVSNHTLLCSFIISWAIFLCFLNTLLVLATLIMLPWQLRLPASFVPLSPFWARSL